MDNKEREKIRCEKLIKKKKYVKRILKGKDTTNSEQNDITNQNHKKESYEKKRKRKKQNGKDKLMNGKD